MTKTLPTERLVRVLTESTFQLKKLQDLQQTLRSIVRDWGQAPPDVVLDELRNALDHASIPMPTAIPEAIAYLRMNGAKLASARRHARKKLGVPDGSNYLPDLGSIDSPEDGVQNSIQLENMEKVLAGLNLSSED